jgi:apolipoprotein N-acyltransferase
MTQPAPTAVAPTPAPTPPAGPPRFRVWTLLLAALTTASLLWLSYFPVDCGWLAWFALVPLLVLVRTTVRARVVYLAAWLGGLAFYFPALQWLRVADPRMYITWIGLAVYCSLYFPLGLFFVRFLDRRTPLPLALTLPAVWTALEFLRSWFATGFSWYLLGHTQHDYLPLIQFADLTGAYGVTFLVAAVNAVLFEALYRWDWFRTPFAGPSAPAPRRLGVLLTQAGVAAAALAAAVGYGEWRLGQDAFTPGPRIALIQGSVPQQIRNNAAGLMEPHFCALCDLASVQNPQLIVWPESSFPKGWVDASRLDAAGRKAAGVPDDWEERQRSALDAVGRWKTNMLLATDTITPDAAGLARVANSALQLDADNRVHGRYDKIHCVPFGEYVPFRDWLPWMKYFAPYDFDYSVTPGSDAVRFSMEADPNRRFTFGVAICYEDTDPDRTRPYAGGDGKPPVDFLLNISNDGWFDGTSEHDEHLAICRFRAIECRRSVGRAVNMGVSAVIDGEGRVLAPRPVEGMEWNRAVVRTTIEGRINALPDADERKASLKLFPTSPMPAVWLATPSPAGESLPPARWGSFKKAPFVLLADVPIDHRISLYALWGDWLAWGCWALLAVGVVLAVLRPRLGSHPVPEKAPA